MIAQAAAVFFVPFVTLCGPGQYHPMDCSGPEIFIDQTYTSLDACNKALPAFRDWYRRRYAPLPDSALVGCAEIGAKPEERGA